MRSSLPVQIFALVMASLSGASVVKAQDTSATGTPTPSSNRGQIADKLRERFNAADTDHDGFLSKDEAAKGMPHVAQHFDEIDANHDGKISMQEIAQYFAAHRRAKDQ